jgi:crotonobetainyl-CoA:carnitine CoA-transferase CaiB-like acyl-CoA transferase
LEVIVAKQALEGLRIVDCGSFWSVPFCTGYLGWMGAEVIKVESIQNPDHLRFGAFPWDGPWWETTYYWLGANTNKLGLTLNLNSTRGKELFKELVKQSDVVIENYSARVMDNFGLTYEVLSEVKPNIIMLRAPAYGMDGPWRDVPSFALALELCQGLAVLTGYPGGKPHFLGGASDVIVGTHLIFAVLTALEYRRRSGKGQLIDVSQMEVGASFLGQAIMDYSMNQREWGQRMGSRDPVMVPHNVYRCKGEGKFVAIAISSDDEWKAFCQAIGSPKWTQDEKFSTIIQRRRHLDELDKLIEEWTAEHDNYEVMDILQKAGVAAGALVDPFDTPDEPQFKARGFFQELTRDIIGTQLFSIWPIRMSKTSTKLTPPPTLGQHNEYVLGSILGLSKDEIEQLNNENIIGTVPTAFKKD